MDQQIKQLESRIDELIRIGRGLRMENAALKAGRDSLVKEQSRLAERRRMARRRLDGLINRLQEAEQMPW